MIKRTELAINTETSHQILWRCLDTEGVDTCLFSRQPDGWQLSGTAIFRHQFEIVRLDYQIWCDPDWNSLAARVNGWNGSRELNIDLERTTRHGWQLSGAPIIGVDGLVDVDLGFTPATNTNAIKRLNLRPGEKAEITAVWLDIGDWTFKPLPQIYHRRSDQLITYISPLNDYQADLEVDSFGIVRCYPNLWQAV